ncbi:hypothetical protein GOP47_0000972 [Adiantum capillus-veneris]|uniref:Protein kinase domain-containing protein n=1 Tax=Adiantum capillus-veneris TaxID=13818 RepID=A0A9D4ZR81_ADICA|nr:hypothetical protein GOP47_0000972 [Adiantum capillus-veneris]
MAFNILLPIILKLLLVLLLPHIVTSLYARSAQENANILLQVKALLVDPTGSLRTWTQERTSTLCENWQGITCDRKSSVTIKIIGINLSYKNLSGGLSPAIGSLRSLQVLNMSYNMLVGRVPAEIAGCESLKSLDLSNNNFSGEIPIGLSMLTHLETLCLWTNSFAGPIPQDLAHCSQLKYLDLGGSYLEGEIPHALGNLSNLVHLTLAGNKLSGVIPRSLGQLKKLEWLYIGYNQLTGGIPSQLGQVSTLKHLDLVYNSLTGELPHSLTNLTNLEYLFLYDNQLHGFIPPTIANLTKLISLDLSSNMMSGSIPRGISNLRQLQILNLFDNGFSGEIPHALAEMRNLEVLALWMNNLTGEVPSKLGSLNNLTLLDLSSNQLRGHVPHQLCTSQSLHNLILFANSLSGPIPPSLALCRSLRRVRLQGNHLSGSIPAAFACLPHVYYLDLSSNNLSGRLDNLTWDMPSLQVLRLQGNNFTGSIPASLQKSKSLNTLDLSQNLVVGGIPFELGSLPKLNKLYLNGNMLSGKIQSGGFLMCKQLTDINLSNNQLIGFIPKDLAKLESLCSLDLSHNQFSGVIPPELGDMDSLVFVNLSFNCLSGEVPQLGAFIQINASSIEGNTDLCGASIGKPCMHSAPEHVFSIRSVKARIFTAILFLMGLMIAMVGVGNVIWKISKQEKKQMIKCQSKGIKLRPNYSNEKSARAGEWALTLFQTIRPSIGDIMEAMKEEKVVEKGSAFCVLYKGSTKGGAPFGAMEMILSGSDQKQPKERNDEYLRAVLGTIAKSRHPNIVNVYGICCGVASSIMVLELVEGCRLKSLIQHGCLRGVAFNAERRLQVAIDVAEAIAYLHSYCSPPILHACVSSNNVIIEDNFVARLLPPNTPSSRFITETSSAEKELYNRAAPRPAVLRAEVEDGKGDGFADDVRAFGELLLELAAMRMRTISWGVLGNTSSRQPAGSRIISTLRTGEPGAQRHELYCTETEGLVNAIIVSDQSTAKAQQVRTDAAAAGAHEGAGLAGGAAAGAAAAAQNKAAPSPRCLLAAAETAPAHTPGNVPSHLDITSLFSVTPRLGPSYTGRRRPREMESRPRVMNPSYNIFPGLKSHGF